MELNPKFNDRSDMPRASDMTAGEYADACVALLPKMCASLPIARKRQEGCTAKEFMQHFNFECYCDSCMEQMHVMFDGMAHVGLATRTMVDGEWNYLISPSGAMRGLRYVLEKASD